MARYYYFIQVNKGNPFVGSHICIKAMLIVGFLTSNMDRVFIYWKFPLMDIHNTLMLVVFKDRFNHCTVDAVQIECYFLNSEGSVYFDEFLKLVAVIVVGG